MLWDRKLPPLYASRAKCWTLRITLEKYWLFFFLMHGFIQEEGTNAQKPELLNGM